jgi:hypothetical protein
MRIRPNIATGRPAEGFVNRRRPIILDAAGSGAAFDVEGIMFALQPRSRERGSERGCLSHRPRHDRGKVRISSADRDSDIARCGSCTIDFDCEGSGIGRWLSELRQGGSVRGSSICGHDADLGSVISLAANSWECDRRLQMPKRAHGDSRTARRCRGSRANGWQSRNALGCKSGRC